MGVAGVTIIEKGLGMNEFLFPVFVGVVMLYVLHKIVKITSDKDLNRVTRSNRVFIKR
jgi:hypothetical protein